jgi:hypothetical protein
VHNDHQPDEHSGILRQHPTVHNERSLVAAFVKRNKRDRYRKILSNPRLRHTRDEALTPGTGRDRLHKHLANLNTLVSNE